ncbi:MAG: spermidine/putrescine ABC transporter substrate-binding protein [Ruminococcaceae bacterium]|nr:spermidine/putrescine ABC transporter substrate-binding protein [Oscillospiraceae bacterium]
MNRKIVFRILFSLMALALLAISILGLSSCGQQQTEAVTLYVYNWGEYMSDGSEGTLDANAMFEDWYYKTYGVKVKVNYSTYSSNESMYAKIKSGSVNYDVIVPSDYTIQRLINDELLAPLNYDNIDNIGNLAPEFYGEDAKYDFYDPGNIYSVPYMYGMIGIIYNTSVIPENEDDLGSWSLMWDEDYKGNILQFNNSRDAFGTAQYYLHLDVNSPNEADWRAALEKLKEQKKIVQGYVMDEIYNKMENGSAAIAAYYAGDYLTMYEENEDLEFYYPEEGTNLYVDAMCIPKASQNKEIAERYINFMLTEEVAVANAEYTYYASPNRLVRENQDYIDYLAEIKEDAYEKIYDTDSVYTSSYEHLSDDKLILLNNLWEELKSDMEIGLAIYIICGVIIATLAGFGIFFAVRKRMRKIQ